MAITDLSFVFFILPILTAAGIFIKGRMRDGLLCLFSLLFIFSCDIKSFRFLLFPLIDLVFIFFLRRLTLSERKIKLCLDMLMIKSGAALLATGFFFTPDTPIAASFLFFDIMAINFFRVSGRSLNELDFSFYVLFFPKLFAGPYPSPKAYLKEKGQEFSLDLCAEGIVLFIWGCGKEIILVNQLDGIISNVFYHYKSKESVLFAWLLALLCALKVYLYLSAFGDMGRGIGKIFMLNMPKGAFYPFFSPTIREFIKRLGLSLWDNIGAAVSFWGRRLKKKTRNYIGSFISVFYINILLLPLGMSFAFTLYFGLCLLADYLIISRFSEDGAVFTSVLVFILSIPAFSFILPMDLNESLKFFKNLLFMSGAPLLDFNTLYFSAANIASVLLSAFVATGFIYAGGSFLKKVASGFFKGAVVLIIAVLMLLIASFSLLEGGV